ncbi:MAG: hypothetical protein H2056_06985 [Sphingopyxis sp.]|nr:hypothetical protein [Sphingopyxis sp.]
MKLLLTLLALLTGFTGGEAVRVSPVAPSAFGAAMALAGAVSEGRAARQVHRPQQAAPLRFRPRRNVAPRLASAAPRQLGIPSYGLRTRE